MFLLIIITIAAGTELVWCGRRKGREWAANFDAPSRVFEKDVQAIWSYPQEYIDKVLAQTPRDCHFDRPYVK